MSFVAKRIPTNNCLTALERIEINGPIQHLTKRPGQSLLKPNPTLIGPQQNHQHVLKLYRKIVRSVPRLLMAYEITGGPNLEREAVLNVRALFERNRDLTDPGVVSVLRHKCEMELSEALLLWKTKSHVCNVLLSQSQTSSTPLAKLMAQQQKEKTFPKQAQQSQFLSSFYQG